MHLIFYTLFVKFVVETFVGGHENCEYVHCVTIIAQ